MRTPSSIDPQSASPVSAKGPMQAVLADIDIADREATADQRVLTIGDPIPVVFCKEQDGDGGAWVSPVAGLYGAKTNPRDGDYFAFGMVISDGRIGTVALADVYKGATRVDKYPTKKVVFAYGSMPTSGFDFTLSSVTPGDPGTPSTPGYWTWSNQSGSQSYKLDWYQEMRFHLGYARSCNVNLIRYGVPRPDPARLERDGVVIATINWTYDGVNFVASYSGSFSPGDIQVVAKMNTYDGYKFYNGFIGGTWEQGTWNAGDPGIPPTPDVVSDLPLFAGTPGTYAGMSCLSVGGTFKDDSGAYTYRQQVRCFVRNGIEVEGVVSKKVGSSNLFPDLAMYLLRETHPTDLLLIDRASFATASLFCSANRFFFNGVLASSVNLRDYLTRTAKLFLLAFVQEQGRFRLTPLLPITSNYTLDVGALNPSHVFTGDDIVAGSLSRDYVEATRRQPFCALVSWRAQREAVFGVIKSTEVRYTGTAVDGPFEQYDLSDFCVTQSHATMVAKYILAQRKHVTHTVQFALVSSDVTLAPMSLIRIELALSTSEGEAFSSVETYLVDAVKEGPDGSTFVEATHFPLDAGGRSLIIVDMIGTGFTISE